MRVSRFSCSALLCSLLWASGAIIAAAQEGPRESLRQLLLEPFLSLLMGRDRTELTLLGGLGPSIHPSVNRDLLSAHPEP